MKVPKYIENAINQRARYAEKYVNLDSLISDWIVKNNVDCEYTYLNVEPIMNPYSAAKETLEDIKNS